ncbi:MAG: hypothetical protein M1814_003422 [Vezdaea aestivalis]|nr:MAG: hypothetical protein M1814_003422 [Vezdaea aestivalis]
MAVDKFLGPLTTLFAPQLSCFIPVSHVASARTRNPFTFRYLGAEAGTQCHPSGALSQPFTATDSYFSPGRCPSSYYPSRVPVSQSSDLNSYICCPSSLTATESGCGGTIFTTLNYLVYDIQGRTFPFSGADPDVSTSYYVLGPSMQVKFQQSDISLFNFNSKEMADYGLKVTGGPLAEASMTTSVVSQTLRNTIPTSTTSSTSSPRPSIGLSIGLGVGLGLGGLFVLCSIVLLLHSRRKRNATTKITSNYQNDSNAYSKPRISQRWAELDGAGPLQELDGNPRAQLP